MSVDTSSELMQKFVEIFGPKRLEPKPFPLYSGKFVDQPLIVLSEEDKYAMFHDPELQVVTRLVKLDTGEIIRHRAIKDFLDIVTTSTIRVEPPGSIQRITYKQEFTAGDGIPRPYRDRRYIKIGDHPGAPWLDVFARYKGEMLEECRSEHLYPLGVSLRTGNPIEVVGERPISSDFHFRFGPDCELASVLDRREGGVASLNDVRRGIPCNIRHSSYFVEFDNTPQGVTLGWRNQDTGEFLTALVPLLLPFEPMNKVIEDGDWKTFVGITQDFPASATKSTGTNPSPGGAWRS